MIAIMRKLIHTKVYKIFLWAFLFMMVFGSGVAIFNFGESKNWVLKAYSQSMTNEKFQSLLKMAQRQQTMYRQKGLNVSNQDISKETVQSALGGLLAQHCMDTIGLRVPQSHVDAQVQQQLQQLPPYFFNEKGELDQEAFRRLLAPHTMEEFVAEMAIESKNKVLFGLVDTTVYVPSFETVLQYNADFADKQYSYIALPYQKYLSKAKSTTPSDEQLNKFYKKSSVAEKFRIPERRAGTVWTFDASNFGSLVSDAEAKLFYDKNKMQRYVLEPAQMQVRTLLVKVEPLKEAEAKSQIEELLQQAQKDPSGFEGLVRKFSQDSKSASRGGLTEFFAKDDKKLDPAVVEVAFESLSEDGQISAPVKTAQGYELVQRVKRNPAKYKDFKSVEAEIKKDLAAEKFKKRFAQDAARVVNAASYNPESLQKFIQKGKATSHELALDVRKPGMEYTHLFKAEQGRYSVYVDKDKGFIVHCSQLEKSKLPSLEDVKSKLLITYFETQAFELLKKELSAAFADAKRMNLQEVASKYGASVQKASFNYANGKAEQSAILKEPEVHARLKGLQHVGALAAIETKVDGIVIKLDAIDPVSKDLFNEQKDHLSKVMFYMKLYQIKEGFIASLYRTAKLNNKIEIKNELLQLTKEV